MSSETLDDHQYYGGFQDPTADMIIETTDNKRLRVHSHTLRTQSAYFRSMPEHAREPSGHREKVVHLDVDSKRFAKLLSFLNDGPEARARLDWLSLKAIAETGERYQFDIVPDLVARGALTLLRSGRSLASIPYPIFKFAAQHDYYELARLAIQSFGETNEFKEVGEICELYPKSFDGVSGRYVADFFQAMAATPVTNDSDWDWDKTSAEFYV